jgi:hypothetical protein
MGKKLEARESARASRAEPVFELVEATSRAVLAHEPARVLHKINQSIQ